MKMKNILLVIVVAVLVIIVFYSFLGTEDQAGYAAMIMKEREQRDRFMKTAKESPLADKDNFKGLVYYPPDIRYKVIADLDPIENRKTLLLNTSDGKQEPYAEYAYANFKLDGKENRLLIMEMIDDGPSSGKLFLAFADETSAGETYGAGRYLDLTKVPGASTITLDFNQAYNPYCAYNSTYSCPLPPPENILKIPIKAGEKTFDHQ